jgi:hypothetical protein
MNGDGPRRDGQLAMVPFFDFETGRVVQIPAAELRPGAVQARVQGIEGIVWILPDQIEPGELKHEQLDEELRALIRQIQDAFAEPRPLSFEEWEDGFRRDANPEREIALWLHAANVYTAFADQEISPPRRDEIYQCVVGCLVSGPEGIWHVFKPQLLGRAKAEEIVARFFPKR